MINLKKTIGPLFPLAGLLFLLATLPGCTQLKTAPPDEPRIATELPQSPGEAVALLYYFDSVRGFSAPQLAKEIERMRLLHVRNKTDFYTLQYALLLSVPGGDGHRAQQLLEPLTRENGAQSRELRALALLLTTDLAERRRLEDGVRKADDLEKKLEALKNIEKNLIQRDVISPGEKK